MRTCNTIPMRTMCNYSLQSTPGVIIPSKLVYRHCQSALRTWMAHNMLKLNCSKTQFMVVAISHALPQLANISLRINNEIIAPSTTVWNFGVEFDSALKMNHHVSSLCRSQYRTHKAICRQLNMRKGQFGQLSHQDSTFLTHCYMGSHHPIPKAFRASKTGLQN